MSESILGGVQPVGLDKCMRACVHHYSATRHDVTVTNTPGTRWFISPSQSPTLTTSHLLLSSWLCLYRNEIRACAAFAGWLLSLASVHLRFLHVCLAEELISLVPVHSTVCLSALLLPDSAWQSGLELVQHLRAGLCADARFPFA